MHQSSNSCCWVGVSRSTGVSRDGLSRLSMRVEVSAELCRLSMRVEEMVLGNVSGISVTGVDVISSFLFLFGSFLMGLVWNCF